MNFKTIVEDAPVKSVEVEYPRLMEIIKSGDVLLMTNKCSGFVVRDASGSWGIGHHSDRWAPESQRPFTGKLIFDCTGGDQ